ncbi:MAG: type VI secretion system baseplate subunit TssE [Burkholderiales bacterium]|nr:type VI secretion system baseplate subunit TssE [Burkholderiales bacterium]
MMTLFGLNLLEKLTDERSNERGHTSIEQLKDSVARDVESLLNSRCGLPDGVFNGYQHCQQSLLSFGLKDFVSLSLAKEGDRDLICDDIRAALRVHEPRLQDPVVQVSRSEGPGQRLHFAIQALLIAHEANEVVSFDAVLQPVSQRYQVSRGRTL